MQLLVGSPTSELPTTPLAIPIAIPMAVPMTILTAIPMTNSC
jgi:hypothetical protein